MDHLNAQIVDLNQRTFVTNRHIKPHLPKQYLYSLVLFFEKICAQVFSIYTDIRGYKTTTDHGGLISFCD